MDESVVGSRGWIRPHQRRRLLDVARGLGVAQFVGGSGLQVGEGPHGRGDEPYAFPLIYGNPLAYDDAPAAGSVTRTRLGSLRLEVGRSSGYRCDSGEGWYHRIDVIAIGEADPKVRCTQVVARVGDSPPRYPPEECWDEEWPEPRTCDAPRA